MSQNEIFPIKIKCFRSKMYHETKVKQILEIFLSKMKKRREYHISKSLLEQKQSNSKLLPNDNKGNSIPLYKEMKKYEISK